MADRQRSAFRRVQPIGEPAPSQPGCAVIQHAVVPLTDEILDKIPDWLNSLHNIDAADRKIFAAERTYTAWVRTGLTAAAAGLSDVNNAMACLRPLPSSGM